MSWLDDPLWVEVRTLSRGGARNGSLRTPNVSRLSTKPPPLSGGRLRDIQQLFQLRMLPGAQQLYGGGTVRLQRVKSKM